MLEVEVKFRSPGNGKMLRELENLGARRIRDGVVEDVYFGHPVRDFGETDEAVRIRTEGERTEITYKGPRMRDSPTKAREELTVGVDDALSARRMLERLGFTEFATVRKRRASFMLDRLRVDVDDVEGLGEFVELEVMTEEPARGKKLIDDVREKLTLETAVGMTYLEMLAGKGGR